MTTQSQNWRDWCPHVEQCLSLEECCESHSRSEAAWQRQLEDEKARNADLLRLVRGMAADTESKCKLETLALQQCVPLDRYL